MAKVRMVTVVCGDGHPERTIARYGWRDDDWTPLGVKDVHARLATGATSGRQSLRCPDCRFLSVLQWDAATNALDRLENLDRPASLREYHAVGDKFARLFNGTIR